MNQKRPGAPNRTLGIFPDLASLNQAAATAIVRSGVEAVAKRSRFDLALAGGNTPRGVYQLLARDFANALPWEKVHLWFGDERRVPPEDPASNYRMVRESLLANPAIRAQVHRIEAELDGAVAAERYEAEMRRELSTTPPAQPRLDLVLLGMGTDGHTASLFPGTAALAETARAVVVNAVPQLNTERVTLTYPVLNNARQVIFLTAGSDKTAMLRSVLEGGQTYPSQRVNPVDGSLQWMVDAAAAAGLA